MNSLSDFSRSLEDSAVEALRSKLSCLARGYLKYHGLTAYLSGLPHEFSEEEERLPQVNRGYYVRMVAIRQAIQSFIRESKNLGHTTIQIINLGCGYDPLHLYLKSLSTLICGLDVKFIDVDLPNVMAIKKKACEQSEVEHVHYESHSADLNEAAEIDLLNAKYDTNNIRTLFVCECVMTYMPQTSIERMLRTCMQSQLNCWVSFDVFNVNDRFGQTMVENLRTYGLFIDAPLHWDSTEIITSMVSKAIGNQGNVSVERLTTIFDQLDPGEKKRVNDLEFIDEIEEIVLIENHAFICTVNI